MNLSRVNLTLILIELLLMNDTLLKKRIIELAERTYRTGIPSFTPFLGLAEQDVFRCTENEIMHVPHSLFGGADGCERIMVRFGDENLCGYEIPFPIELIQAEPLSKKFADNLSHRDILGAIMNLGIDRSTTGDIILRDNTAYIFCTSGIASYIEENLVKAKHTDLSCKRVFELPEGKLYKLNTLTLNVASERIDCVVSQFLHVGRNEGSELIRQGKLFINGRVCESPSKVLKQGDIVSVRGYGRFIFRESVRRTKTGRLFIAIDKFV